MRNICELRSHFPTVPFLLLTATCTKKVLRKITDQLHLPDLCIETFSPDRPNIYLHWNLKCQNDPVEELSWLLDELRTEGREMKKTLIYVRSISKAATLFRDAIGSLRDDAYLNNIKSFENSLVALYHAGLNQEEQEHVLQELPKSDSIIRIVICTVAFGMGVNITDIRYVIHWGACDTIMEYWQEVGRAGRDGKDADAISYITPSSKIHVSDEMKQLVKDIALPNTCIRKSVLSAFIGVAPAQDLSCLCRCCSNCRNQCVHE
ncbi:hypothetical protein FSP39_015067 [Pinctada imbricata]|uniref:DNA 3'-5' helicase n=1 Tax=Pinctada imbricata TaxID=66713 RepID=A0AA89C3G1_PINIB|nr:hypothetical protein FSP39_015067 [Pinctada imbricata]